LEEIAYKIQNNQYDLEQRNRSPSPTPVYDSQGRRLNTRDQRAKDKLNLERQRLVQRAKVLHEHFKPPADYKPVNTKKFRKIYIPVKEYPNYNFFGLIVGPRGSTQKQMEKDTGCKIAIRGKGSLKPGKGGQETQRQEDENDELHVLITGDDEVSVNKAADLVQRLLVPVDDSMNEHKKDQLRKLAEWNGTLRDNMPGAGINRSWQPPDVFCKFCGELSHPSSDCPLKNQPKNVDSAYESFMAMIGEGGSGAPNATEQSYAELMASINAPSTQQEQPKPPQAPAAQPQQPGYPPQQGGYPPAGGYGYPPQQGGYYGAYPGYYGQ
jgi:splicing factor 1